MKIYTIALLLCCLAGAAYASCMSGGSSCGSGGIDVVTKQQQIFPLSYTRTTISSITTVKKTTDSNSGFLVVAPEAMSPYSMTRSYKHYTSFSPCGNRILHATDSVTSYVSSYPSYYDFRTNLYIYINLITGEYIYYDTSSCGGGSFYRVYFNPYTQTTYLVEVYTGQLYVVYVDCNGVVSFTETSYLPDAAFQLYGQISLSLIFTNEGTYYVQARDLINGVVVDISVYLDMATNIFIVSDFLGFEYAIAYSSGNLIIERAFKTFITDLIYIREDGGSYCSLDRIIDSVNLYQTTCTKTSVSPYIRSRQVRSVITPPSYTIDINTYLTITFLEGTQRQFRIDVSDDGCIYTTSLGGYQLLVYVGPDGGITLFRIMTYNNEKFVILPQTRQLMRVTSINGVVTLVPIDDASFVVSSSFSMYSVQYCIDSEGNLGVTNIDLQITFTIPIVVINTVQVVTDYLTGIEYVIIINPDGSVQLIQCWVDEDIVIVEYEGQFAVISYTQQTYYFTSIEWNTVIGIIDNDLGKDSRYYVSCAATQTLVC